LERYIDRRLPERFDEKEGAVKMTSEKIFINSYEDFIAEHPEYLPEWKEFVEPVILAEDDALYGFLFGYLLV